MLTSRLGSGWSAPGPSGTLDGFLRGYVQEIAAYNEAAKPYAGREEQGTQVAAFSLRMYPKAVTRQKGAVKGKGNHIEVT